MICMFDLHPWRSKADLRLRQGIWPGRVAAWVNKMAPDERPVTKDLMRKHRHECLGLESMRGATNKIQPITPESPPPAPAEPSRSPSKQLGRPVTEEDVNQRLLTKFYDSIDSLSADKVAEVMIERAKAEQKRAPAKAKDDDDPTRTLAGKIGMAMGARPTRTGSRIKRAS
ncbi:MAG: hypothetical protein M3003_09525 [Candidatus Dormibacteraeota bacterium]|nr:hypothetical protein [Candidatus Dormibacteraeota bacterium]